MLRPPANPFAVRPKKRAKFNAMGIGALNNFMGPAAPIPLPYGGQQNPADDGKINGEFVVIGADVSQQIEVLYQHFVSDPKDGRNKDENSYVSHGDEEEIYTVKFERKEPNKCTLFPINEAL